MNPLFLGLLLAACVFHSFVSIKDSFNQWSFKANRAEKSLSSALRPNTEQINHPINKIPLPHEAFSKTTGNNKLSIPQVDKLKATQHSPNTHQRFPRLSLILKK